MRTFIAIEIERPVLAAIGDFIVKASEKTKGVSWSKSDNMHLTVRFLGEVDEQSISSLSEGLREALIPMEPFAITLKGTGGFPNLRVPRVLWVGIEPSRHLRLVHEAVEGLCEELGFGRERRPFSPHITIGRVKGVVDAEALRLLSELGNHLWGTSAVRQVNLMKSLLRPTGAEYSLIASAPLRSS